MNIANYITILRLIISPIFMLIYLESAWFGITSQMLPYILLGLFIVSELSDFCDGFFARRLNQVTELGKILDPMADSISRIGIFLAFTQPPVSIPMYLVFLIMYRDSVVSTLRTICALRGFALAARPSGKLKAVVQALSAFIILLLMVPASEGTISQETLYLSATIVVSISTIYTLFSGFDYIKANWVYIMRLLKPKSNFKEVVVSNVS